MGDSVKRDLKKIAQDAQVNIVRSLLNWKYRREGKQAPDAETLKRQSKQISRQANDMIAEQGKNLWDGLKKAYKEGKNSRKDSEQ